MNKIYPSDKLNDYLLTIIIKNINQTKKKYIPSQAIVLK